MRDENCHPFLLDLYWPELRSAINQSLCFRTTMVVTMPKFQRDIPTLAQVLAPLLSYKKKHISKVTILDLQAEVRVSTNSLCGRKNPYWTGIFTILPSILVYTISHFLPRPLPSPPPSSQETLERKMERLARKDEEVYSWRPCTDDTLMINDKGRKSLGREAENSRWHFRG